MRKYLISNLAKGFIVLSKAPFTLLVRFAYKGNRSLRFYINYCKLSGCHGEERIVLLKWTCFLVDPLAKTAIKLVFGMRGCGVD
jgi:hypothetical protein